MKVRLLLCFLICSSTFQGCKQRVESPETVRKVKLENVKVHSGRTVVSYSGRMKAVSDINVAFKISGTLEKVPVEIGQHVRKGQVIAVMDQRDYLTQFTATEAEYSQIKADASRVMELFKRGSASASENDKATYGLQQITAKYNAHKNALADTRLLAPTDGYIQKKLFEAGETVGAGMPVISMISGSKPEVEVNITVSDFTRLNQVQSYTAIFNAIPGKEFPLEVIGITQKANLNQLYTLRLKMKDIDKHSITPGMAVNVIMKFSESTNELVTIPISSLFKRGDKTLVWIYKNGEVHSRPVTVSEIIDNGKVIVKNGITDGEMILTAGVHSLKEGDRVQPMESIAKTNIGGIK